MSRTRAFKIARDATGSYKSKGRENLPDLRLPQKHAFGPLQLARVPRPWRSKHTAQRIRRWAKRAQHSEDQ